MIGLIDFSNPKFNYEYKGYTAIINQVIDIAIHHYEKNANLDLMITDNQILENFNLNKIFKTFDYNASDIFLNDFENNLTRHNVNNAHTLADNKDLNIRNKIFNDLFTPKNILKNEIDTTLKKINIDNKTLGIQIRGTDKIKEIPKIPNKKILDFINKTLKDYELNKIFLSTDDNYYIELLKNTYKELLIYNEDNLISYDGTPLHFSNNRKKTNKDVLIDVYLLSNCEYFLYCYSNVSYLALTLGSNKQKFIKNINDED